MIMTKNERHALEAARRLAAHIWTERDESSLETVADELDALAEIVAFADHADALTALAGVFRRAAHRRACIPA